MLKYHVYHNQVENLMLDTLSRTFQILYKISEEGEQSVISYPTICYTEILEFELQNVIILESIIDSEMIY